MTVHDKILIEIVTYYTQSNYISRDIVPMNYKCKKYIKILANFGRATRES